MTTRTLNFDEFQRVICSTERKGVHFVMKVFDRHAFNPEHMRDAKSLAVMDQRITWGLKHSMDKKLRRYLKEQQRTVKRMRHLSLQLKCSMALLGVITTAIFATLATALVG